MQNENTVSPTTLQTRSAPSRWVRWALYGLAIVGAICLGVLGFAVATWRDEVSPTAISADEAIDQLMTEVYGAYSDDDKAWVHQADDGGRYLLRVVHRAKIVDAAGKEELYFLVSGHTGQQQHGALTGAFKLLPGPAKTDGSLMWASSADLDLGRGGAVEPNDIRFEALSHATFGWVVKRRHSYEISEEGDTADETWNIVLAPRGDKIVEVAEFIAAKHTNFSAGCAAAQARYADWAEARADERMSAASSPAEGDDEPDTAFHEDAAPPRCTSAKFSYRTGPLQEDGFVTLTVTGGGLVNGEQWAEKSWRMVFDAKGFVYHVPAALKYLIR